jgi:hypothetical protein
MTSFDAHDYLLDSPGKLIAALPAVLGFVPEYSVILVTIARGELACAMRADLGDDALAAALQMVDVAAAGRPDRAILVIVDEAGTSCRMCDDEHRDISDAVGEALGGFGIALWATHVVDRVAAGGRWHCVDGCGSAGLVDDPASSPLAAEAVLEGRRMYARREELLEAIAVSDPERTDALAVLIDAAAHTGAERSNAAARRDVELAMAASTDLADGGILRDDDIARLAYGLTDPRVRDMMYALAVGSTSSQVEALWALLARVLPPRWRTEVLVLLAFSAYVRGDGTLAGVALSEAKGIDPRHRMANMLDQALQTGMRPEQIREVARTGFRLAKRIGVQLPPRRIYRRRAG